MIIYYAPGLEIGKPTRAAAICQYLDDPLVVITGDTELPLDYRGIPYRKFDDMLDAEDFINESDATYVISDTDHRMTGAIYKPHDFVYRLGRPTDRSLFSIEPPGSSVMCWPIVWLDDDEILSKEEAREDLGFGQTEYIEMAIDSLSQPLSVQRRWPNAYVLDRWPAVKWMRAADKLYGACGSNLWAEAAYLDIPAEWIPVRSDHRFRMKAVRPPIMSNMARHAAELIAGRQPPPPK